MEICISSIPPLHCCVANCHEVSGLKQLTCYLRFPCCVSGVCTQCGWVAGLLSIGLWSWNQVVGATEFSCGCSEVEPASEIFQVVARIQLFAACKPEDPSSSRLSVGLPQLLSAPNGPGRCSPAPPVGWSPASTPCLQLCPLPPRVTPSAADLTGATWNVHWAKTLPPLRWGTWALRLAQLQVQPPEDSTMFPQELWVPARPRVPGDEPGPGVGLLPRPTGCLWPLASTLPRHPLLPLQPSWVQTPDADSMACQ